MLVIIYILASHLQKVGVYSKNEMKTSGFLRNDLKNEMKIEEQKKKWNENLRFSFLRFLFLVEKKIFFNKYKEKREKKKKFFLFKSYMLVRKIIFNKDINNYIYWYDISLVEYHQLVEENKIDKNSIYFINDSKELYLGI